MTISRPNRKPAWRTLIVALAAGAAWSCAQALPARAQTADEIIARNLAAVGGQEKVAAVRTVRMSGRVLVGDKISGLFSAERKLPDKVRSEFTITGLTQVRTYDGKAGWLLNPFASLEPAALTDEALRRTASTADADPFVDYRAKGNQVELAGKAPVDGSDAYRLKVTLRDGSVQYYLIDTTSFLKVKKEEVYYEDGKQIFFDTVFRDYRAVDGLLFPFLVEGAPRGGGSEGRLRQSLDKIELNVVEDDARFGKPVAPPRPTTPKGAAPSAGRRSS